MGSSAGGHLAILAALRDPKAFDFVVADAPITDTAAYGGAHPYWPTREAVLDGSPLHLLQRGDATSLTPLLITHGTADRAYRLGCRARLRLAMLPPAGSVELLEFDGLDHAFILTHPRSKAARAMAQAILRFIEAQTRL